MEKRKMVIGTLGLISLILIADSATTNKEEAGYQYVNKDTVVIKASNKYAPASVVRKIFMGKNYRKTWNTPVKIAVFRLSQSGLKIEKLGGGQQTKSLRLLDQNGREWVLRTVDKDVEGALPKFLRNTIAEKTVQDMISASYPYSAVIVGNLARSIQLSAPLPTIYFVADDPRLGQYRSLFANTICMLEEREPIPHHRKVDTDDTETLLENIRADNEYLILQKHLLKARLLDMLVGDWDRHSDQWRWAEIDSAGNTYYYAIPRDRDNALFYSGGLVPKFAQLTFLKHIAGFKKKSTGLKRLNAKSWLFDKTFLNDLDENEWKTIIREFQNEVSDQVIENAVKQIPKEAYALDGEEIIDKLKSRRDGLLTNALKYYEFISESVTLQGSDKEEIFMATNQDGMMTITMYRSKHGKPGKKLFERRFDPSDTKIIYIRGFNGNDQVIFDAKTDSRIVVKVYGGEGKDSYDIKGNVKTEVIDNKSEESLVMNGSKGKFRFK